jgi:CheY-like chemotaxis protein/DNA-binding MarR family transcriptional regulator
VSQVFVRSDQLAEKVYDIKLYMEEWRILFAVDGKMSVGNITEFLGVDQTTTENAIKRLEELGLIVPLEGETPSEEIEETTEEFVPEAPEEVEESSTEEMVSEEEQLSTKEPMEEVSDEVTPDEEILAEAESEGKETLEGKAPENVEMTIEESAGTEEESKEGFEELHLEEDTEEKQEDEQDLDRLINDLLTEETSSEEGAEGEEPKILGEDEIVNLESQVTEQEQTETVESEEKEEQEQVEQQEVSDTSSASDDFQFESGEQAEPVTAEKPEAPSKVHTAIDESQKTVLVVDDSIVIRKMVEIALENENYNVITVSTGKEAFSFLDEKDPDIVILDIMLPDVNGLDILKAIKARKDIPVVMLSAKDTPKETSKAQELGANDFIPKPFRDEELITKIHDLIGA